MRRTIGIVMLSNAALFVLGAVQHTGIPIGPLHEPVIIPAAIVESICALTLIWGLVSVLTGSRHEWFAALAGNLVAIAGVALGMVALAAGAGPRTASNDLYHRIMLALSAVALVLMFIRRKAAK
jgi:hypothetical protein